MRGLENGRPPGLILSKRSCPSLSNLSYLQSKWNLGGILLLLHQSWEGSYVSSQPRLQNSTVIQRSWGLLSIYESIIGRLFSFTLVIFCAYFISIAFQPAKSSFLHSRFMPPGTFYLDITVENCICAKSLYYSFPSLRLTLEAKTIDHFFGGALTTAPERNSIIMLLKYLAWKQNQFANEEDSSDDDSPPKAVPLDLEDHDKDLAALLLIVFFCDQLVPPDSPMQNVWDVYRDFESFYSSLLKDRNIAYQLATEMLQGKCQNQNPEFKKVMYDAWQKFSTHYSQCRSTIRSSQIVDLNIYADEVALKLGYQSIESFCAMDKSIWESSSFRNHVNAAHQDMHDWHCSRASFMRGLSNAQECGELQKFEDEKYTLDFLNISLRSIPALKSPDIFETCLLDEDQTMEEV